MGCPGAHAIPWRHVLRRAHELTGNGPRRVMDSGNSEICHPYTAFGVHHDVAWLDVSVDNSLGVGIVQGTGDLFQNSQS